MDELLYRIAKGAQVATQIAMVVLVVTFARRPLYETGERRRGYLRRRRLNPALRGGLMMIASGGLGTALVNVSWMISVGAYSSSSPLLPSIVYALCSTLTAAGACIVIRGLAALISPRSRGDMPRPLDPSWKLADGEK